MALILLLLTKKGLMLPLHCLRRYQAWTAESKICEQFKSDVQHQNGYVRLGTSNLHLIP